MNVEQKSFSVPMKLFLTVPHVEIKSLFLWTVINRVIRITPREVSYYAYKRINHFNEWLAQFQAKECTDIHSKPTTRTSWNSKGTYYSFG
jgi:hypothetical protein